jgi:hypothetical protein
MRPSRLSNAADTVTGRRDGSVPVGSSHSCCRCSTSPVADSSAGGRSLGLAHKPVPVRYMAVWISPGRHALRIIGVVLRLPVTRRVLGICGAAARTDNRARGRHRDHLRRRHRALRGRRGPHPKLELVELSLRSPLATRRVAGRSPFLAVRLGKVSLSRVCHPQPCRCR